MLSCETDYRESFASMGRTQVTTEPRPSGSGIPSIGTSTRRYPRNKEIIHSGHFMVSEFEAEAQDDEENVAIPVPDESEVKLAVKPPPPKEPRPEPTAMDVTEAPVVPVERRNSQTVAIDSSLTKLFQCMSLAYRQKLTSPKWNRFKGLKLRWKDKIRLNNIIWRAWHMQFIKRRSVAVCQFASPLDVDIHIKPEAVVLEGKYWKRKLAAVTAEYKKWRIYYRNNILRKIGTYDDGDLSSIQLDGLDWSGGFRCLPGVGLSGGIEHLVDDVDLLMDFNDTLFSTLLPNQPYFFPNPREIARGAGIADFIQPGLVQLQPNLDDFMDTLEPLHDLLQARLPAVPEEVGLSGVGPSAAATSSSSSSSGSGAGVAAAASSCPSSAGIVTEDPILYAEMAPLVAEPDPRVVDDAQTDMKDVVLVGVGANVSVPDPTSAAAVYAFVDKDYGTASRTSATAGVASNDPVGDDRRDAVMCSVPALTSSGMVKIEALPRHHHHGSGGSPGHHATSPTAAASSLSPSAPTSTSSPPPAAYGSYRPRRTVFSSSQPLGTQAASKNLAFERQQQQQQQQVAAATSPQHHQHHQHQQQQQVEPAQLIDAGARCAEAEMETSSTAGVALYDVAVAADRHVHVSHGNGSVGSVTFATSSLPTAAPVPGPGVLFTGPGAKGKQIAGPGFTTVSSCIEWERQQPLSPPNQHQLQLQHQHQQQLQHNAASVRTTRTAQHHHPQPHPHAHQGRMGAPAREPPLRATSDPGALAHQPPPPAPPPLPPQTVRPTFHLGSPKGAAASRFGPVAAAAGPSSSVVAASARGPGFQLRMTAATAVAAAPAQHHHHGQHGGGHAVPQPGQQHHQLRSQRAFVGGGRSIVDVGLSGAVVMAVDTSAAPSLDSRDGPSVSMGGVFSPTHAAATASGVTSPGDGGNAGSTATISLPRKTSPAAANSQFLFGSVGSPSGLKSPTSPPAPSPSPIGGGGAGLPLSHATSVKRAAAAADAAFESVGAVPTFQKEHRRVNHINAEHKRRCNIKNGFDTLQQLIPAFQQQQQQQQQSSGAGSKVSKAAMLHKAADLIRQLKQERQETQQEVETLKAQIDAISRDISVCQSQLPDTGAPVIRPKTSKVMDMYRDFVRQKTLEDWKFWVFSLIVDPVAEAFNNTVSTASFEDTCRTTLSWTEQHCSLVALRPSVLGSLRHLSTNTSILSNPTKLPEEAARAVTKVESPGGSGQQQQQHPRPGSLSHQSSSSSCSSMS